MHVSEALNQFPVFTSCWETSFKCIGEGQEENSKNEQNQPFSQDETWTAYRHMKGVQPHCEGEALYEKDSKPGENDVHTEAFSQVFAAALFVIVGDCATRRVRGSLEKGNQTWLCWRKGTHFWLKPCCDRGLTTITAREQAPATEHLQGSEGKQQQRKGSQETLVQK